MKKFLFLFSFFLLATTVANAGLQTITISRNDGQFESSSGVYYASKGGVTMSISGGMNNTNFLLLKHENTISFRSANFAIKEIIFHCLDNYPSSNLDVFYWGPTTMNVMTVNYKPVGSTQTQAVTPGKYTASGYDGHWTSDFSGTWTSTFKNVTRTHTKFSNGYPAGNTLTFESMGKPIRFSSIDIIVEKEDGDIYDLVTNVSQIVDQHNYLIVNWQNAKALSVNTKEGKVSENVRTGSPVEFISGHVDDSGNYDQYAKVKTDGEAQIIKLEKRSLPISNSSGTINNDRPWLLNAGGNYLRITSSAGGTDEDKGPDLYGVTTINDEYSYAKIELGGQGFGYNARIRYRALSSTSYPRPTSSGYRIAYNEQNDYFRDLEYSSTSTNTAQNIRLYTPAQNYNVTTEVQPDANKGSIALHDGVIVNDASATSGTSQQYETVSFLVNAANGFKIGSLVIQALNTDGTVASTIEPQISSVTTNGTLYTFTMPANDVHIIATFEEVTYHNINMVVKPNAICGNIFVTEGYVVQNDQVKSYDGQNVVFNVTPNLKNINNENAGYFELSYVTVTINGVETTLAPDANGNYTFTMPDEPVTITAYFYDDERAKLWLLGTANGETQWHTYGPRFNYNDETKEYYIDVYFRGTGDFGTNTGNDWGEFRVTWLVDPNDNWNNIKNQGKQGHPYKLSVDPLTNKVVCQNDGKYRLRNGEEYGLNYEYGSTEYYGEYTDQEDYKFTLDPGIYRIYVGTQESQNAGGLGLNVLKAVKYPTALTLDPMGGAEAASAVEVPQNQLVTLEGDIYNKIKAINPQEADANFKYKAVKIIGENVTTDEPVASTTTATTTLTEVNDGETVTELHGYNYLGWIVADNTAFYKVIYTPLSWIEKDGVPGNTYTVSDELIIVHILSREASGDYPEQRLIWAKDQGNRSNNPTSIEDGQIDYMRNVLEVQHDDWDQSNWVMLKFPDGTNLTDTYERDMCIKAGTLKGRYVDNVNYCIEVEVAPQTDGTKAYTPNVFSTPNYLDANLNLTDESTGAVSPVNQKSYFFMNPKVQEVADVVAAVWNGTYFVIPKKADGNNSADLNGAFTVGWDYNDHYDVSSNLAKGNVYSFRGVLNMKPANATGSSKLAVQYKDVTPDATKMVMPFDLNDQSVVTAISDVDAGKTVSNVKYYNIMGVESNKPFDGVNIVVTRYSDGTISTTKVLR